MSITYLWTSVSGQNLNGVTNQVRPLQQYFHRVLFILYVVLPLSLCMKSYGVTIQMKPLQQYFHLMLFILYVVLTFESVDAILWDDHSNEMSSSNVFGKRFAILAYLQISVKQCLRMNILYSFHKLAKYHHNGCSVDFIA